MTDAPNYEEGGIRQTVLAKVAELAGIELNTMEKAATLESLGLDSADAVILAMEVEELVGKEIDVGIFFRFETVVETAEEIERLLRL